MATTAVDLISFLSTEPEDFDNPVLPSTGAKHALMMFTDFRVEEPGDNLDVKTLFMNIQCIDHPTSPKHNGARPKGIGHEQEMPAPRDAVHAEKIKKRLTFMHKQFKQVVALLPTKVTKKFKTNQDVLDYLENEAKDIKFMAKISTKAGDKDGMVFNNYSDIKPVK
mgnify:CR=1 FL=1